MAWWFMKELFGGARIGINHVVVWVLLHFAEAGSKVSGGRVEIMKLLFCRDGYTVNNSFRSI
jgi:hypothetical protein